MGTAVVDTLRSSKQFLREAAMAKLNNRGGHNGPDPVLGDTSKAKPANFMDEVEAKLKLLEFMNGGEQKLASIRAWILEETPRASTENLMRFLKNLQTTLVM